VEEEEGEECWLWAMWKAAERPARPDPIMTMSFGIAVLVSVVSVVSDGDDRRIDGMAATVDFGVTNEESGDIVPFLNVFGTKENASMPQHMVPSRIVDSLIVSIGCIELSLTPPAVSYFLSNTV